MDPVNHREIHLKIADFGLSLIASKGYGDSQVGSVGTVSGSTARPMRWMAPESIRRRQYSEKSD
eukprot:437585-Hanusia_phi.AAC.1